MTQSNAPATKYFDLHTSGIGYLNRIRQVTVRKGSPFLAVTVAALHGSSDEVQYTYIDCKVAGGEAERLVRRCQQAESENKKVLVAFRIGDLWIDTFTYDKGDKKGQTGASLKGRLLFINWIRIDGELVYQTPPKDEPVSSPEAEVDSPPVTATDAASDPDPAATQAVTHSSGSARRKSKPEAA